ncbi:MAG: Ig-like domain-containing protein, partial [Treponema sp.]|nr:Ig-like domain-containing protein [Treponema sp.]
MRKIYAIIALFALCSLIIAACDLFAPSDPNFIDDLYTELAWANAELVNVLVSTGGMGTASPSGSQQVKLWREDFTRAGYTPFTVNYQPFSQYPFTGWQAWYAGEEPFATWRPDGETGADRVKFEKANDTGTNVKIYIYEQGNIYIGPLGADTSNIEVRVIADSRWGTVFTSPVVNTKMGFSFPVEFSVSGAWDFLGWRAYAYTGQSVDEINARDLAENELSPDDVDIEVTGAGRATITINTGTPVLLVPLCVVPVRVTYTNPPDRSGRDYGLSQPVTIAFSTYLDKETIKFGSDFITITGQTGATPFDITERFIISHNENADMVYITPNTVPLPDEVTITITVGTEVKGLYGNSINAPFTFSYNVSATVVTVTNSYQAVNIWALHNPSFYMEEFFQQWGNYDRDRRLRKTGNDYQITLYFGVQAVGEINNDAAHEIEIIEILYANLRGDEAAASLGEVVTANTGSVVITNIDEDTDAASVYYRQQNAAAGTKFYKAVYSWTNPTQGILRLVILPTSGEIPREDWQTVILDNRGYVTAAYDNIAPGGPAL